MAAPAHDAALQEFASTIDLTKAPGIIRCPTCPRPLLNAYKGGCCDTSICESCFSSANNACPQCSHKPYNIDTVKPSISSRKTVKSWLKAEKLKADEQAAQKDNPVEETTQAHVDGPVDEGVNGQSELGLHGTDSAMDTEGVLPSTENPDDVDDPQPDKNEAGDDDVEFQVDLDPDDPDYVPPHVPNDNDEFDEYGLPAQLPESEKEQPVRSQDAERGGDTRNQESSRPQSGKNESNFQHPGQNFNMMNPMLSMQQMMPFPNLMNMQMGMPMANMFGNGGMNGMNGMNMMNPQMLQAFQNNMWQNSSANAFQNGMGGDNFGFQSNFNQHQYPHGDFNQFGGRGRGGRGRGRWRGDRGRGRGSFHGHYDNNHHNNFQAPNQQMQGYNAFSNNVEPQRREEPKPEPFQMVDHAADDDEFAPGGQEEVQEALGDDYAKKEVKENTPPAPAANEASVDNPVVGDVVEAETYEAREEEKPGQNPVESSKPIAEAYSEDLDMMMAPPSAPSGPSRHNEKDFGFRSRGQGKFSRNRGSTHLSNGHTLSPARPTSSPAAPPVPTEAPGVMGAPTGPRAMREPPKPVRKPSGSGFQVMGRASMASRNSDRRSPSPSSYDGDRRTPRSSRKDEEDDHDRRGSHRRSSRYDRNGDYEMRDDDEPHSRADSHDRSRKSRRDKDKDKYESRSSKHDRRDKDYDNNGYQEDDQDADRSHRRDRKHHDRERERDRDKTRDRDRADRDREREDRHREKDRKRRRERDADDDQDEDYDSSRHKSRRHRKDHDSKSSRHDDTNGTSGRSSHRSSQVADAPPATTPKEDDVDPITRERMERDRQRMMKEQQRRDNAAAALKGGGGSRSNAAPRRQMSFKYEDEVERGMVEGERERNRARWR